MNKKIKYLTFLMIAIFIGSLNVEAYVCKVSTSLHENSSGNSYGKIYNGNLIPGVAFDCDLNDNGVYESDTERFYYVSRKYINENNFDNNTAVLIHYSNVSRPSTGLNVVANNTSSTVYGITGEVGPYKAMSYLPSTNDWKNIQLERTRVIRNEDGSAIGTFDYTDNASTGGAYIVARLLTIKELENACSNPMDLGALSGCNFLLENTKYDNSSYLHGYHLETLRNGHSEQNLAVNGSSKNVVYTSIGTDNNPYVNYFGVRPVIEVPIKDLDTRILNTDTQINQLTVKSSSNDEYFDAVKKNDSEYTVEVPTGVNSIEVSVSTLVPYSTITINGGQGSRYSKTELVTLSENLNSITIEVTAEDGLTSNTYTLNIVRKNESENPTPSNNCAWTAPSIPEIEVDSTFDYKKLMNSTETFSYRIKDTSIATVSNKGIISTKKEGKTKLVVTSGECEQEVDLKVVKKSSKEKIMFSTDLPIYVNETLDLGNKSELKKYSNLKWVSDNSNIVEVDSKGVIKAKAVGAVTITAENDDILYTVNVKVYSKVAPPDIPGTPTYGYLLTDDENNEVSANELDDNSEEKKKATTDIEDLNKVKTIEVTIKNDDAKNVIVFYLPEGYDKEKIAVYRLENGKYVRLDAELINGEIRLKDSKEGVYAIAELNTKTNIPENGKISYTNVKDIENPKTGNKLPVVLALVGYLTIVGIVIYLKKKNKLSRI
ncbi:MAG: hypothetical protein E7158_05885 [Firmicutes bacterium]|nr:hypothetical protein [Bacillota bacterium]